MGMDKIDIKGFILNMELNKYYGMPPDCRYKWMKIEKGTEYYEKDVYYCWAMEYNYNVCGCTGYIHPYGGTNKVKHFKTEAGAKRNLTKYVEKYFASFSL
jgi:hypothetical protein